jgi:ethanolamine ammonia-lyase small subunit
MVYQTASSRQNWIFADLKELLAKATRPGLSSPDSLGAYLTYAPRPGLTDAERNCVSNIRAGGLDVEAASSKLVWLVVKAFNAGVSGVQLKDESDACGRLSFKDLNF